MMQTLPSAENRKMMKISYLLVLLLLIVYPACAQLESPSKAQLLEATRAWTGDRFEDGRPKVPESILRRMKTVSAEEAWSVLQTAGFHDHFERGWERFNPSKERL